MQAGIVHGEEEIVVRQGLAADSQPSSWSACRPFFPDAMAVLWPKSQP
jgi:hypothetical protein